MFGKHRSSIPVLGSQTGIPVRRTEDKNGPTVRSTQGGANSRIPVSSKVSKQNKLIFQAGFAIEFVKKSAFNQTFGSRCSSA